MKQIIIPVLAILITTTALQAKLVKLRDGLWVNSNNIFKLRSLPTNKELTS